MSIDINEVNLIQVEKKPGQPVIVVGDLAFPVGLAQDDIDLSGITAGPEDILAGKQSVDSAGEVVSGTIPTVTPQRNKNVVTIQKGYVAQAVNVAVPEAGTTSVVANVVTTPAGYVSTSRVTTVGTAKAAATITPSKTDQVVSTGTYLSGPLTIKGDSALLPENIAEGKQIFGVTGNYKGTGGDTPAGTSMDFYKCAAVYGPRQAKCVTVSGCPTATVNGNYLPTEFYTEDWEGNKYTVYSNGTYYYFYNGMDGMWCIGTDYNSYSYLYASWGTNMSSTSWQDSNWEPTEGMSSSESEVTVDTDVPKTWDGYKAVSNNGVYSFENEVTTGIPYTETAPKLYGIYSRDLSVQVERLDDGNFWSRDLAFYASLEDSITRAETGQELKPAGSDVVNTVKDGVKCAFFEGQSGIVITDVDKLPQGDIPTTIFMNICPTQAGYSNAVGYAGYSYAHNPRVYIDNNYGTTQLRLGWCADARDNFTYDLLNKWVTMTLTKDAKGNAAVYYGKNVMISEANRNKLASYVALAIGSGSSDGRSEVFKGYINQFRMYKRSFTYDEVCNYIDIYGFAGPFTIPAERQKIMYWNMNDTGSEAVDSINGIVLTKSNNVTSGAAGISGTCWELPADSSGYLAGKNEKVALPQKFTLHFAVNIAEEHSGTCGLVEFGSYDYTSGFGVWYDGSNLAPRMSRNYNNFRTPITKGAWHWVSFTYDGQDMKLYVDGVLTQTTPHKLLVTFDTSVKMFVRGDYTDSYQAHCKLDEVSLYNYAMTDAEISELVSKFTPDDGGGSDSGSGDDSGEGGGEATTGSLIRVTGSPDDVYNGDYQLTELTTTAGGPVYKHINNEAYIYLVDGLWFIHTDYSSYPGSYYYNADASSTIPATSSWMNLDGQVISGMKSEVVSDSGSDDAELPQRVILYGCPMGDDTFTYNETISNEAGYPVYKADNASHYIYYLNGVWNVNMDYSSPGYFLSPTLAASRGTWRNETDEVVSIMSSGVLDGESVSGGLACFEYNVCFNEATHYCSKCGHAYCEDHRYGVNLSHNCNV